MNKLLPESCLIFLIIYTCIACSSGQHENVAVQNLNREDRIRYEQYLVQGEMLYLTHCANCHQADGSGLRQLIPPLAKADYMLEDVARTMCLIKYGIEGEIVVNGVDYNHKMPANEQLKTIEITQIANFIYNSWGNTHGLVHLQEASSALEACHP